jgi:hypothetical protein
MKYASSIVISVILLLLLTLDTTWVYVAYNVVGTLTFLFLLFGLLCLHLNWSTDEAIMEARKIFVTKIPLQVISYIILAITAVVLISNKATGSLFVFGLNVMGGLYFRGLIHYKARQITKRYVNAI